MRIFKRGKYYWIDFTFQGKRYRRSLKTTRKEVAEQYKAELELRIFRGEFFGIIETPVPTLKEFVENTYLQYERTHKASGTQKRNKLFYKNLLNAFGDTKLSDITLGKVTHYLNVRGKIAAANREISLLRAILNYAVRLKVIPYNPIKGIKLLKESPGRVRYLTQDEFVKLVEAASSHLKAIIQIAVFTGLRKSDLLKLKWSNIDFENKRIRVHVTKTNEIRFVPMNDLVIEILQNLPRNGEYVFTYKGKRIKDIKRAFTTACIKAGIRDLKFHDLRHTFASWLVMSGVDLRTVAELMGHKTLRMVQRYSHLSPGHLQDAVNKIGTLVAQKNQEKDSGAVNILKDKKKDGA